MEYARVWPGVAVPPHLAAAPPFSSADGYFYHQMRPVFPQAFGETSHERIIHHPMDDTLIFNDHTIHRRVGPPPGTRAHAPAIHADDSRILDVIELPTTSSAPRNGLTTEERISKFLETRTSSSTMIEEEICAVCHDEFVQGHTTLDCDHKFHRECIKTWLLRQNSCPMCRAAALPILNDNN